MHQRRVKLGGLSPVGELVRRHDPDRFFTALFAPAEKRELLFLLYAFNHELARAREVTAEPTIALIRLQWWREVVEGAERRHAVAEPLHAALAEAALPKDALLAMIAAREAEADPGVQDMDVWRRYVLGSAGGIAASAGAILGASATDIARLGLLGAAYGAAGILRSVEHHARHGQMLLPLDLLMQQGLSPETVVADPHSPALGPVRNTIAEAGRAWLNEGRGRFPRATIAAALPAVFARRDLRGTPHAQRGVADRLAVIAAAVRRRV